MIISLRWFSRWCRILLLLFSSPSRRASRRLSKRPRGKEKKTRNGGARERTKRKKERKTGDVAAPGLAFASSFPFLPTIVMTLQRSICFFSSSMETPLLMERRVPAVAEEEAEAEERRRAAAAERARACIAWRNGKRKRAEAENESCCCCCCRRFFDVCPCVRASVTRGSTCSK